MQLDIFVIIAVFSGLALVGLGFVIGRMTKNDKSIYWNDNNNNLRQYNPVTHKVETIKGEPLPEYLQDTNSNDIQPGIVYRPSKEEIDKMNEPQKTREAKEAIAETLKQEIPPEI